MHRFLAFATAAITIFLTLLRVVRRPDDAFCSSMKGFLLFFIAMHTFSFQNCTAFASPLLPFVSSRTYLARLKIGYVTLFQGSFSSSVRSRKLLLCHYFRARHSLILSFLHRNLGSALTVNLVRRTTARLPTVDPCCDVTLFSIFVKPFGERLHIHILTVFRSRSITSSTGFR